jgi:hypothetical protein
LRQLTKNKANFGAAEPALEGWQAALQIPMQKPAKPASTAALREVKAASWVLQFFTLTRL